MAHEVNVPLRAPASVGMAHARMGQMTMLYESIDCDQVHLGDDSVNVNEVQPEAATKTG